MQLQSIIKKFDDGSVYYSRAAQYDEFGRIKNVTNNFPAADGSEGDTYTCDYTYENGNMSFYTAHDKCTTLCTTDDEHNLKKYESKSEYSNITTTFGYDKLTEEQVKMYEIFNTYFLYFFTPLGSFEKMEASLGNNMLSGLDYYLQVTNYPYIVTKAIYNNI